MNIEGVRLVKIEQFYFRGQEDLAIHTYKWVPEDGCMIKGVVQIAHGMAEEAYRYKRFASFLVENGYVVYINDHRGHGKSAETAEQLGHLAERRGFEYLVLDMHTLTCIIKDEYPGLPVFLFSHSMGSFATQEYIMHYGEHIDGAIISGSNGKQGIMLSIGAFIAAKEVKKKGRKAKSPLLDKLIFGKYNKPFQPNRTPFDWLSRDNDEVDKYIANPFCGTVFTAGFFDDFMGTLKYIEEMKNIEQVPKDLPIYIFSGDRDPVGKNGKGVMKLVNTYKKVGLKQISYKLYPGGRHEMLNETNKEEVMQDVLDWINAQYK